MPFVSLRIFFEFARNTSNMNFIYKGNTKILCIQVINLSRREFIKHPRHIFAFFFRCWQNFAFFNYYLLENLLSIRENFTNIIQNFTEFVQRNFALNWQLLAMSSEDKHMLLLGTSAFMPRWLVWLVKVNVLLSLFSLMASRH